LAATVSLRSIGTFAYRYSSPLKIIRAVRYPGIRISSAVRLDIRGQFTYEEGCTIGVASNLIVKSGATLALGQGCAIGRNVELGPEGRIEIGNETSVQDRSILLGDVTLGCFCSIAPNVYISSGRHWFDLQPHELIKDQDRLAASDPRTLAERSRPIVIDDDCWLGVNAVVMPGVRVGKGAVIGANSVITRDVEPYTVVAGVPARLLWRRLEFVPPRAIDAARAVDRPYFYSGFQLSRKSGSAAGTADGLSARGAFVLALDRRAGRRVHLTIRTADGGHATIDYRGSLAKVSGVYSEIAYDLQPEAAARLQFDARSATGPATIVLQRAWVD
jgi:acetyltransferase-like isoleucine patch superfamily enzyme